MGKYAMAVDLEKCIGCGACIVACKAENRVPPDVFRLTVYELEQGTFPDVKIEFRHDQCRHCEIAPCVSVCPTGASFIDTDGLVRLNATRCIGCKACVVACPYDARFTNPEKGFAEKCSFCDHRLEEGKKPACVETCPTSARVFGDLDDPKSDIRVALHKKKIHVPRKEMGTRPKFFYLKKKIMEEV